MRNLFVLACFVFALSLRAHAADEQTVTVKNVSIAKGDVSVKAELQGKTIHLWCSTSGPFCAEPTSGEYSMVRAVTADDAIYQDCTDVVLFKSSGGTKKKVGVYCWLDSGDCYMSCGSPLNVETIAFPMRKAVEPPTAEPVSKIDKPAAPALGLAVRTDQQTYRMSDKIKMETQLLNIGSEDVYIWDWDLCWNPARGLSMYLTTSDGSPAHGDFLFDCVPPPPKEGNAYAFIKLEPGRFYGVADEIKVTDVVSKPGEYDISVTYNSFVSRSFIKEFFKHDPIAKLPLWTMEQPTITAPRVHIVVKP